MNIFDGTGKIVRNTTYSDLSNYLDYEDCRGFFDDLSCRLDHLSFRIIVVKNETRKSEGNKS